MDLDANPFIDSIQEHFVSHAEPIQNSQTKVKRPLNAYNLFYLERQPVLKSQNQSLNGNEVSRLVAKEWEELPQEGRQPYVEEAKKIQAKFRSENPNYRYEKSSYKQNKKKHKISDNKQDFYNNLTDINDPQYKQHLYIIGASYLAQFIISRKDLQNDLLKQFKFSNQNSDVGQNDFSFGINQ